jgi:hypothetical protein
MKVASGPGFELMSARKRVKVLLIEMLTGVFWVVAVLAYASAKPGDANLHV